MNYITKKETLSKMVFLLIGTEQLIADKITSTYEVQYQKKSKSNELVFISREKISEAKTNSYDLQLTKISAEELKEKRIEKIPSFVLKQNGILYYTEIHHNWNLMASGILGHHMCSDCHRLSAASDEEGGCEKVRRRSTGIERYSWIQKGFETFGTKCNALVVTECSNFEPYPVQKKRSINDINKAKLSLAQFFYDDVQSLEEVVEKTTKKHLK